MSVPRRGADDLRGRGRRLDPAGEGVEVHDVGDDAGDVVGAAALQGELHERVGALAGVLDVLQGRVDRVEGDQPGEAVGAQQPAVAHMGCAQREVQLGIRVDVAEHAHEHRALRMPLGLVLRESALVQQALDEGVVLRDLDGLLVAQEIGAGVADVGEGELALGAQQRGDRGAQAPQLRLVPCAAQDLLVRLEHALLEGRDDVGGRGLGVQGGQAPDRDRGGDVAAGVAAHAVGDHQQVAARVGGVLVVRADQAHVGAGGIAQGDAHRGPRLSSISVRPIRTCAPGRKGTAPSMRRPETRVPLVEPRSSTIHSSSRWKTRACRLEA